MAVHAKKWLRGLRGKFLFVGLIILCVFCGAGTGALYLLKTMNAEIDYAYDEYAYNIKLIEQMKGEIHAVGRFAWITYGHTEDATKRFKFLSMGQEAVDAFDQQNTKLKNKFTKNQEFQSKLQELDQYWPGAKAAYIDASNLFKKSDLNLEGEIKGILQNRLAKNLVPLTLTLNEIDKLINLQSEKKHEILDRRISSIKKFTYLSVVLFLGFLVAGIWALFRSIKNPLDAVGNDLLKIAGNVDKFVVNLSTRSQELSNNAQSQALAIQQTSAAVIEISSMIERSSDVAKDTAQKSSDAQVQAEKGEDIVRKMTETMSSISSNNQTLGSQINESNHKISSILTVVDELGEKVKVINDIVFQTKLLSFNASVEAARAGEHGRGFAVVAEEVGNLAMMSGKAAQEINEILGKSFSTIQTIINENKAGLEQSFAETGKIIKEGESVTFQCSSILKELIGLSKKIADMMGTIAESNQECSKGVANISDSIVKIDSSTQSFAQNSKTMAGSTEELVTKMIELKDNSNALTLFVDGSIKGHKFVWKEEFFLDVKSMDDEHLILVEKINHLADVVYESPALTKLAFEDLAAFTVKHFQDEEAFMASIKFPELVAHKKIHEDLLSKVTAFGGKLGTPAFNPEQLLSFLNDWLMRHILNVDRHYAIHSKSDAIFSNQHNSKNSHKRNAA